LFFFIAATVTDAAAFKCFYFYLPSFRFEAAMIFFLMLLTLKMAALMICFSCLLLTSKVQQHLFLYFYLPQYINKDCSIYVIFILIAATVTS